MQCGHFFRSCITSFFSSMMTCLDLPHYTAVLLLFMELLFVFQGLASPEAVGVCI
jgi:hypothetical protein